MAKGGAVILAFAGDTTSLEAAFKRVQAGAKGVEASANTTSSGFKKMGAASKIAAAAVLGMGVALVKGAVDEALKAQTAQAGLGQALRNAGIASGTAKEKLQEYADAQTKRGFSDIDATQSLQKLVTATHSATDATKLNSVAEDLARTRSISLASATDMLVRLHAGNVRALKSMGIVLNPVTTAVDKLKASTQKYTPQQLAAAKAADKATTAQKGLVAVMQATHGQADKFAGTDAGKIAVFHASWEHLQVELGNVLLPALGKVMSAINSLMDFIDQHKKVVEVLAGAIGGLALAVLTVHRAMAAWSSLTSAATAVSKIFVTSTAAATVATEGETAAQEGLNTAMELNPIGIVVTALLALGVGLYEAWQHSQTFRDIVTGAFNDVKTVALAVAGFFTHDIPAAFESVIDWLRGNWQSIATIISGPFTPIVAFATNAFGVRSALVGAFEAVKSALGTAMDWIGTKVGDVVGAIKTVVGTIAGAFEAAWSAAKTAISPVLTAINDIISAVRTALGLLNSLNPFASSATPAQVTDLNRALHGHGDVASAGSSTVLTGSTGGGNIQTTVTKHALGGVFSTPHMGIVAEAGPEAIVPLSKPHRAAQVLGQAGLLGGGGSTTINLTVNSSSLDPSAAGRAVVTALQQFVRRNGSIQGVSFA